MNKLAIELGGKERTLKFNMLQQEIFDALSVKHFTIERAAALAAGEASAADTFLSTGIFLFSAASAYCRIADVKEDFTLEDCIDWAEEMTLFAEDGKSQKIADAYANSTVFKFAKEAKKKLQTSDPITTGSEPTPSEKSA